jgi:anti-sigma regulatory factor (Ser/Thr protein kinase)
MAVHAVNTDDMDRIVVDRAEQLAVVRSFVRRATAAVVASTRADDVALVVSELVTNALEYGSGGGVEIAVDRRPDHVDVWVASRSDQLPTPTVDQVGVREARGRGLQIVAALSDGVSVSSETDTVRVVCRFDSP